MRSRNLAKNGLKRGLIGKSFRPAGNQLRTTLLIQVVFVLRAENSYVGNDRPISNMENSEY